MNAAIKGYVQTDLGRKRTENEDNFIWVPGLWDKPSMAVLGAIDGVGGYEGGAEAAAIARQTIENYLAHFSFGAPGQLLKEAIINANNTIHGQRAANPHLSRMSCVLSSAILDAEKEMMYIGHVGDSRGYLYRNGELFKITKDHSVVGMQEDSGYLTEEEAMHHPRRNEISKMMGEQELAADDPDGYIEITEHSFLPGDIVLFCSDGLSDLVNRAQIIASIEESGDLKQMAQSLIDKANASGGKDNITVALAVYNMTRKPARKKTVSKKTIEIPVASTEAYEAIEVPQESGSGKKWRWPLFLAGAFVVGFFANWPGTKSFIRPAVVNVDTAAIHIDTLPAQDTFPKPPDTLINTKDTISRDSARLKHTH